LCVLVNEFTPQLSFAAGTVQLTDAPQLPAVLKALIVDGHPAITGFSLSITVISNEHVILFPASSVAVYVTVVVPTGNTSPLFAVLVNVFIPQLSAAVGAIHVTDAPQIAASFTTDIFEGHPKIEGS
jgi:hypothetical protein